MFFLPNPQQNYVVEKFIRSVQMATSTLLALHTPSSQYPNLRHLNPVLEFTI